MSARRQPGPYDNVARKWLDLAERRKTYFIELYDSGRWERYYTQSQMVAVMRATIAACDAWAKIVNDSGSPAGLVPLRVQREFDLFRQRYRA
jgi:uncharacterized repeat protein (TIGR03809 family)